MTITVSTDGSALGNPNGPMGWAWADHELNMAHSGGHEHGGDCDAGGATNGTNQIGELCAVLEALRAHPGAEPLVIETDSQYAINCSTKWVHGWKKNGWKNSQKKPVKNAALIRAIDAELSRRAGSVKFVWVKGHAGNAGNEKVDDLARTYAGDCRSGVQEGYLPKEDGSRCWLRSMPREPTCRRMRRCCWTARFPRRSTISGEAGNRVKREPSTNRTATTSQSESASHRWRSCLPNLKACPTTARPSRTHHPPLRCQLLLFL